MKKPILFTVFFLLLIATAFAPPQKIHDHIYDPCFAGDTGNCIPSADTENATEETEYLFNSSVYTLDAVGRTLDADIYLYLNQTGYNDDTTNATELILCGPCQAGKWNYTGTPTWVNIGAGYASVVWNTATCNITMVDDSMAAGDGINITWKIQPCSTTSTKFYDTQMNITQRGTALIFFNNYIESWGVQPAIADPTYCSGSAYNPPGDWDITSATTCTDENFGIDGNITISGSGSLSLVRTNITFNVSQNNSFFQIDSASFYSIDSIITTNDSTVGFMLNLSTGVGGGKEIHINSTNISRATRGTQIARIENSDNILIKDSNFSVVYAFYIANVQNLRIIDSNLSFFSDSYGIRFVDVTNITISGNTINATRGDAIYGSSLNWVNYTTIYNNYICPDNDEKAIYISKAGPGNNISLNYIWGKGDVVYISSGESMPSNLTLSHNTIKSIGTGNTYGFYLTYQNNATIFNNTIDVNYVGMSMYQMVDGNVTGNKMRVSGATGYAFSLANVNFTDVFYNNFTGGGWSSVSASGGGNTFYKNNITLASGKFALALSMAYNTNFTENNITNLGLGEGINITYSDNNHFYNNYIKSGFDNAITVFGDSTGNTFTNDVLSSQALDDDIYFNDSGTVNFTNVTFDKERVGFRAGSTAELYVNWYVRGYVNKSDASPLESANFTAWNVSDNLLWYELTSGTGYTKWDTVQQFIQNRTGNISQQNTTFNASKIGYWTNETSINVSISMQVNITLWSSGIADLSFSITVPGGNFSNSSLSYPGPYVKNITFEWNTTRCSYGNVCGNVLGCVGTDCESAGTPLFIFTNTGSVALDWYINFSAVIPAYAKVYWNATSLSYDYCQEIQAGDLTKVKSVGTGLAASLWMWANFSANTAGDQTNYTNISHISEQDS